VKIFVTILFGILGLNLILIASIAVVLIAEQVRLRRKESNHEPVP
jgi:hypothetical protein